MNKVNKIYLDKIKKSELQLILDKFCPGPWVI